MIAKIIILIYLNSLFIIHFDLETGKREIYTYLESLMSEVLDGGLEFVVSVQVDWVSGGVESLLEVWLE